MANLQIFPPAKFSLLCCSGNSTLVRLKKLFICKIFSHAKKKKCFFSSGIHKPEQTVLQLSRGDMKKKKKKKKKKHSMEKN